MTSWSGMSARILMVVLGLAAVIAFAPTKASAHAGHAQHQISNVMQVAAAVDTTARYNVQVVATMSAGDTDHAGHSHDDGRGCCPNGHCGGFCGVLAPMTPAVLTVTQIEPLRYRDAVSPPGTAVEGPARPPQSIA